jgi:hypothetical protein
LLSEEPNDAERASKYQWNGEDKQFPAKSRVMPQIGVTRDEEESRTEILDVPYGKSVKCLPERGVFVKHPDGLEALGQRLRGMQDTDNHRQQTQQEAERKRQPNAPSLDQQAI